MLYSAVEVVVGILIVHVVGLGLHILVAAHEVVVLLLVLVVVVIIDLIVHHLVVVGVVQGNLQVLLHLIILPVREVNWGQPPVIAYRDHLLLRLLLVLAAWPFLEVQLHLWHGSRLHLLPAVAISLG